MLSVSDVTVGVWNSGDYTIELGVSRDLKAFLKIKQCCNWLNLVTMIGIFYTEDNPD
jgi:hypothetical protein